MSNLYLADLVYEHLVCEFGHYDCCLTGLMEIEGRYFICKIDEDVYVKAEGESGGHGLSALYKMYLIQPQGRFEEYLYDYSQAYPHWFKDHRKGPCPNNIKWLERSGRRISFWSLLRVSNHSHTQIITPCLRINNDHIIPIASFDFTSPDWEEQVGRACHYTNLQPLWAEENMKKGAKF